MSNSKQFARRKQRLAAGSDAFTTDRGLEPKEVKTDDVRLAAAPEVKTASDQKSPGRYVTLIQTVTNKLQLVPNPTTIKEFVTDSKHHLPNQILEALVLDVDPGRKGNMIWSDDTVLEELLTDLTAQGWQWLDPKDFGLGLGTAPILEAPDGRVYWHEKFQAESAGEALLLGTTVTFDGAPENKPLASLDEPLAPEAPVAPAAPLDGKLSSKKTAEDHGTVIPPSPAAEVTAAPPAEPAPAPAPAAGGTTGKYKYWTAEALSEVIETLSGITDFSNDKAAQQAVAEMAEELNSRPKAAVEPKKAAKTAAVDPELQRQIDYAIEGIYKFQINGEQDTQLITKALQSLKNITTHTLSPEQQQGLTRAIDELEAYDQGNDGDIARAVVELEDVVGRNWSTKSANFGSFAVNEETSKVLEGDKSIPDGRDKVEDNTGITRPATTTPSKVATVIVNDESSKVLEGDKSIPDGREKVEDKTGITKPATESPSKFAAEKIATIEHRPGHKNSKGEAAPWVNVDKAGKVVSSSKSKEEAEERLRAMEYYKNASARKQAFNETLRKLDAQCAALFAELTEMAETGNDVAAWDAKFQEYRKADRERTNLLADLRSQRPVVAADKQASEMATSKAVNLAESMAERLKSLYLDAKPLTSVNGTRPVRDAVESVYAAMVEFGEAAKVLAKQDKQEKDEEAAAAAALPKKKAAAEAKARAQRIGGLCVAADSPEDDEVCNECGYSLGRCKCSHCPKCHLPLSACECDIE